MNLKFEKDLEKKGNLYEKEKNQIEKVKSKDTTLSNYSDFSYLAQACDSAISRMFREDESIFTRRVVT